MRALVWDGSEARVVERPSPDPRPGWATVRVALAGVCNTDLEIARGYMGFRGVLGHEFVGTVADGPAQWHGRRVVGEINFACGACERCDAGWSRHCASRSVMGIQDADGAFAEYLAVPIANLHPVPTALPDEVAVFCEPLAAACEVLEQVELIPEQHCTVLGDGKLGLLIAQVLDAAGARVLCVGRHAEKLAILRERGIETMLLQDWLPRHANSADLVVEASGRAEGFELAVEATRPRGTLVLKSTVAKRRDIDLTPVVVDEIHIVGSRCGPFPAALSALAQSRIDVRSLVSQRFDLAHAAEALAAAARPGAGKVLIDCSERGSAAS
jgi:threonine dehydrogenase-like Zn-dependent dehydrogenase